MWEKGEKNSSYNETVIGLVNMAEHDAARKDCTLFQKCFPLKP